MTSLDTAFVSVLIILIQVFSNRSHISNRFKTGCHGETSRDVHAAGVLHVDGVGGAGHPRLHHLTSRLLHLHPEEPLLLYVRDAAGSSNCLGNSVQVCVEIFETNKPWQEVHTLHIQGFNFTCSDSVISRFCTDSLLKLCRAHTLYFVYIYLFDLYIFLYVNVGTKPSIPRGN